jgi:ribose/xylose/arabinose/galactoside ABC-type transport system permease subunit
MERLQKTSFRSAVKNFYVFGILAAVVLFFAVLNPQLLSANQGAYIIQAAAPSLITALAMTMLMISGNIDLSIGGTVGLTGVVAATLSKNGMPLLPVVLLCVLLGIGIGAANGFIVLRLRITPVIATIAMMNLLTGIARLLCPDETYAKGVGADFDFIGRMKYGGWPIQIFFIIFFIAIFAILEKRSILGKYSIAIGGNAEAARLAGIKVQRVVWLLYILVGAASAVAGCLIASNMKLGNATAGTGFELDVITAVLIGGTSWAGGEGSVIRSIAGAVLLTVLSVGLNLINVEPFFQYVVKGCVLIAAVLIDKIVKERVLA